MRTKVFVIVFLLSLGMGSVLAESPQETPRPVKGEATGQGKEIQQHSKRPIPNIPINKAEQARPADDPEAAQEPETLGSPTNHLGPVTQLETAFARELAELRTSQQAQLEEIAQRLRQTTDPQQELPLQLELDAAKQEVELELLRLQMRHAQAAGRTEVVEKIQQAITQITSPQPVIEPQDRSASRRTNP